jgi:hypothetical protein
MDDEITYLDNEDLMDQQELSEEQQEVQDSQSIADIPYKNKPESLYTLFQKVWRSPDSSKLGNLNSGEMGRLTISVRDCQHLAMLSNYLHHARFAAYFKGYSEIILSTSMSRKGWFVELFVSQKKFTSRSSAVQPQVQKKSWIFGKKEEPQESQAQTQ